MDRPSVREQALAAYARGPAAVVGLVEQLVVGFGEQRERGAARVAAVEGENTALRAEIAVLRGQRGKDSHNRSKPAASDGLKRAPKSLRGKSGRRPGDQPGHAGQRRTLVEQPDAVVVHAPSTCGGCGQDLGGRRSCDGNVGAAATCRRCECRWWSIRPKRAGVAGAGRRRPGRSQPTGGRRSSTGRGWRRWRATCTRSRRCRANGPGGCWTRCSAARSATGRWSGWWRAVRTRCVGLWRRSSRRSSRRRRSTRTRPGCG